MSKLLLIIRKTGNVAIQTSNYLLQILKLYMVLFKLEMILRYKQTKNDLETNPTNKSNIIKLIKIC